MAIIKWCAAYLADPNSLELEHLRHIPPWLLLLLVKWTLRYGELHPSPTMMETPNDRAFRSLVNAMHDFDEAISKDLKIESWFLLLRSMAFQQFWQQRASLDPAIARQIYLFSRLDRGHPFHDWFEKETRLTIEQFLRLSLALATAFIDGHNVVVTGSWFGSIQAALPPGTVDRFLDLLSMDYAGFRQWLEQEEGNGKAWALQLREETPLILHPLLRDGATYLAYSPPVLFRSLEGYVYNALKQRCPSAFMDRFGPIFERYALEAVSRLGLPCLAGSSLSASMGSSKKRVDAIVCDDDVCVLIEVKGVQLAYLGRVSQSPTIVADKVETSFLKGLEQGFATAEVLAAGSFPAPPPPRIRTFYLLVVTYEEMYIGTASDYYQFVEQKTIDDMDPTGTHRLLLPLEHVFITSVNDLDLLAETVKGQHGMLASILQDAVKANRHPDTMKLVFKQHLQGRYAGSGTPEHLRHELHSFVDDMKGLFATAPQAQC